MATTTKARTATSTSGTKVWDLADSSQRRTAQRRGLDLGGPIAAALGAIAICAAAAPALPTEARWCLVIGVGLVALLVAASAIRRRQALSSLLLAAVGLLAPIAAVGIAVHTTATAKPAVTTTVVSDRSLLVPDSRLLPTPAFAVLADAQRTRATEFATALALRLRTLHGSFGPYPASLQLSNGSIVEGAGLLQGTPLGSLPTGSRLDYHVTTSGSAFEVVVVAADDEKARITATNALVVQNAG